MWELPIASYLEPVTQNRFYSLCLQLSSNRGRGFIALPCTYLVNKLMFKVRVN